MQTRLCLMGYDELYVIDLPQVLYIQADDHYAHVYYASGTHFMVPYGLSRIESMLADMGEGAAAMVRMGRKYIVNSSRIFRVNTVREQVYLNDDHGNNVVLHIPKAVLRLLLNQMANEKET